MTVGSTEGGTYSYRSAAGYVTPTAWYSCMSYFGPVDVWEEIAASVIRVI